MTEPHILCLETVETLATAKNGHSWRGLALTLGYDAAYATTLNQAARNLPGCLTRDGENRLRARLGLAPLPALIPVAPCEDCGAVHTGRCHGKPVVSVVVIGPDERVTRKPTKIIRRWADLPPAELARALAERVPYEGRIDA